MNKKVIAVSLAVCTLTTGIYLVVASRSSDPITLDKVPLTEIEKAKPIEAEDHQQTNKALLLSENIQSKAKKIEEEIDLSESAARKKYRDAEAPWEVIDKYNPEGERAIENAKKRFKYVDNREPIIIKPDSEFFSEIQEYTIFPIPVGEFLEDGDPEVFVTSIDRTNDITVIKGHLHGRDIGYGVTLTFAEDILFGTVTTEKGIVDIDTFENNTFASINKRSSHSLGPVTSQSKNDNQMQNIAVN